MIASKSPVIFSHFDDLTDPRMDRTKRHLLIDMVVIALCAAICGAEGWADVERFGNKKKEWFARFLQLPGSIPSHDTFGRVFARLDTSEFYACLQRWVRTLNGALTDHGVRLDGRRSGTRSTQHPARPPITCLRSKAINPSFTRRFRSASRMLVRKTTTCQACGDSRRQSEGMAESSGGSTT